MQRTQGKRGQWHRRCGGDNREKKTHNTKCTKDGIAEMKVKFPGMLLGKTGGEENRTENLATTLLSSWEGSVRVCVCVWRRSSNRSRIGAEDGKSGSCQVSEKKPGKKELGNEACSCWAATNKSSCKTKLLWQTCGLSFLNQGYLHKQKHLCERKRKQIQILVCLGPGRACKHYSHSRKEMNRGRQGRSDELNWVHGKFLERLSNFDIRRSRNNIFQYDRNKECMLRAGERKIRGGFNKEMPLESKACTSAVSATKSVFPKGYLPLNSLTENMKA